MIARASDHPTCGFQCRPETCGGIDYDPCDEANHFVAAVELVELAERWAASDSRAMTHCGREVLRVLADHPALSLRALEESR